VALAGADSVATTVSLRRIVQEMIVQLYEGLAIKAGPYTP
jgi:hypothetical protein